MNIIDNTKKSEEIEKIEDICRRESLNSDSVIYDESKNKINLVYGSKEDIHATIEYDDEQKKIKFRETENVPFITKVLGNHLEKLAQKIEDQMGITVDYIVSEHKE